MGLKIGELVITNKLGTTTLSGLGVFVSGAGSYNAAAYDFTQYAIPGRNGDLIIPNGRYQNIQITYPAFIPNALPQKIQDVRNWLRAFSGYSRISDTYDPDHYRMGFPVDVLEVSPVRNQGANFQIVFECMPQRFLSTGNTWITINRTAGSSDRRITNPTPFVALPAIQITNPTSSTTITFANEMGTTYTMSATAAYTGTVTIDSDTMNIYSGSTNLNYLFSGDFPKLEATGIGYATVSMTGVNSIRVQPRWWEL